MPEKSEMSLFRIHINKRYRDSLLTFLSNLKLVHIKSSSKSKVKEKKEEKDPVSEKIKILKQNFLELLKRLDIGDNFFQELRIKKEDREEFEVKDLVDLLNYLTEEINFFLNRIYELERYIARARIELNNLETIKAAYHFLDRKLGINRKRLKHFEKLDFKVYSTFKKNQSNLITLFRFSEFPNLYDIEEIGNDRIVFYVIYPKEKENDLKERINVIHGEEVQLLLKYLTHDGINFERIEKEIDLIQNNLQKYQKELDRIRDDNIKLFASIKEIIQNIEEYNWAERQFIKSPPDLLILNFYAPSDKTKFIIDTITKNFEDKIDIETINIKKKAITKLPDKFKEESPSSKEEESEKTEEEPDLRDETPRVMRNNPLFRPYETLTKMYGTPAYSEIDPTPFLFFTFPIIFGSMFGDIGHGLCLIIAGLIGGFLFRKREGGIRNFSWIIFYCGIGAMLFGFLYGEFFGQHTLLGIHLEPITIYLPIIGFITLHNPINNIITLLKFSLVAGVIHINLGWFLQFLNYWKQSRKYLAITDSFFKILLLTGGAILILTFGFNIDMWLNFPYPILLPLIPGILLIISKPLGKAIGISYMKKETFGELIGEGSIETFETLLSVLSNVSSYIRLLALALAHISLMLAIEQMIDLINVPAFEQNPLMFIVGQALVIIGLIFGNFIIIILEGLLVFINTLRLHFYEFFFKFYQGSGIEYDPFRLNNDYSVIHFKAEEGRDVISEEIEKEIEAIETQREVEHAIRQIKNKYL